MLSSFPCKAAYSIISANHCNKISISPHKNHTQHGFSKGHFRFSKSAANSQSRWFRLVTLCQREQPPVPAESKFSVEVGQPIVPAHMQAPRLSLEDQAFFLLAFIACTTSIAFTSLVIAAVPTLYAMGRAATSVSKLADTAREELPSTMAAIRLSGIEISDLTLELSDLSQEIADGVSKSAQAVQAAEAGIRQIGSVARHQTMSAAKKTSHAVGQARKSLMNIISRGEVSLEDERNESEHMDI